MTMVKTPIEIDEEALRTAADGPRHRRRRRTP